MLTGRGTFQKFYQQDELKSYLEEQLGTDALPAAPGVFYAFKDESRRQQFIAFFRLKKGDSPLQSPRGTVPFFS